MSTLLNAQALRLVPRVAAVILSLWLAGCVTNSSEVRIDNVPMYGQPGIARPDVLKRADEDFIKQASAGFGGSREDASKAWAAQADRFMGQGNLDFAMRRYNQAWLLDPDNYQPYWGFGRVMLERDRMDEAIAHLERALALCGVPYQKVALLADTGSAHMYKAVSLPANQRTRRSEQFGQANDYFRQATEADPGYANAWKRWAYSLYREGDFAQAWTKVRKAQSLGATGLEGFLHDLAKAMPEPG